MRTAEVLNLLKTGTLSEAAQDDAAVAEFLLAATEYLADAQLVQHARTKFIMAYDGYFSLVAAYLAAQHVRTADKPGHRSIAITFVAQQLRLPNAEVRALIGFHNRRNDTTYGSPIPPPSQAEADTMTAILERALPIARAAIAALQAPPPTAQPAPPT